MVTAPRTSRPRLSVVVLVTAGERDDLERCLASLQAYPAPGGQEVVVVDNASRDGSLEMVARRCPDATIVAHERNLGVSLGRNAGLQVARGRYIAMLDSDVTVHPHALGRLCDFLDESPEVGLVGPRIEYPDGTLQLSARRVPSPAALVANRASASPRMQRLSARRRHLMIGERLDTTIDVEYLLGAAMVFRAELSSAVGGFDPRLTLGGYGFDDADWALRARATGWRVVYLPSAVVTHIYRRRLAQRTLSPRNAGMVLSYALLRAKHGPARVASRFGAPGRRLLGSFGEPIARLCIHVARLSARRRGAALMYHRLGARCGDPDRELVPAHSAALMVAHLRHLTRAYRVVPAAELHEAVRRRRRYQRFPVAITFDDDLLSHVTFALPLLKDHGVTATFFLCGAFEDSGGFWWEHLQAATDRGLVGQLERIVPGAATIADRPGAIHEIAAEVERQPPTARRTIARALAELVGGPAPGSLLRPTDVRALAGEEMEIGFHTREHHALPTLTQRELEDALVAGRTSLAGVAGQPLRVFAYPHGKAGAREAAAARATGFTSAFATAPTAVTPESDPFLLGRIEPSFISPSHFALRLAATVLGLSGSEGPRQPGRRHDSGRAEVAAANASGDQHRAFAEQ